MSIVSSNKVLVVRINKESWERSDNWLKVRSRSVLLRSKGVKE